MSDRALWFFAFAIVGVVVVYLYTGDRKPEAGRTWDLWPDDADDGADGTGKLSGSMNIGGVEIKGGFYW